MFRLSNSLILKTSCFRAFSTTSPKPIPVGSWILIQSTALPGFLACLVGRRMRRTAGENYLNETFLARLVVANFVSLISGVIARRWISEEHPITERRQMFLFSKERQREASAWDDRIIMSFFNTRLLDRDHPMVRRVRDVCQVLLDTSMFERFWLEAKSVVRIFVINDEDFNTFASPSGNLFITRALVELCPTNDRLAVLISHELAHLALEHGREKLSYGRWMRALSILPLFTLWYLIPDGYSFGVTLCLELLLFYLNNWKTRELELEADKLSFFCLLGSPYNVREMELFWGMLATGFRKMRKDGRGDYSATPLLEDRVAQVKLLINENKELVPSGGKDYEQVLKKIVASADQLAKNHKPLDYEWLREVAMWK